MRLKVTLPVQGEKLIPINYQHFLESVIYRLLAQSNLQFASTLHKGEHLSGPKKFKFFTYSWLQIPQRSIVSSCIKIFSPQVEWYISSPWNEFIQYLVNGLLELGKIRIGKENFNVLHIETLPDLFAEQNGPIIQKRFTCLSPIVVTTKKEYKGELKKYYYRPTDPPEEISEKIYQNLINKYRLFHNQDSGIPDNEKIPFQLTFDTNYIKKPNAERLVHYIKNDFLTGRELDVQIKAIMCPFEVKGPAELIKFGYECGFGEENSAGFGMVRLFYDQTR